MPVSKGKGIVDFQNFPASGRSNSKQLFDFFRDVIFISKTDYSRLGKSRGIRRARGRDKMNQFRMALPSCGRVILETLAELRISA